MIRVIVKPPAQRDLAEAYDWYQQAFRDGGEQFLQQYERVEARIGSFPNAHTAVDGQVRRAYLRRFPYSVFYVLEDETIFVLAVIHDHRDPEIWKARRA